MLGAAMLTTNRSTTAPFKSSERANGLVANGYYYLVHARHASDTRWAATPIDCFLFSVSSFYGCIKSYPVTLILSMQILHTSDSTTIPTTPPATTTKTIITTTTSTTTLYYYYYAVLVLLLLRLSLLLLLLLATIGTSGGRR